MRPAWLVVIDIPDEQLSTEDWAMHALCRTDPSVVVDDFFPERGDSEGPALRARCPVIELCLNEALSDASIKGIWGGTSSSERRRMRSVDPTLRGQLEKCSWCGRRYRELGSTQGGGHINLQCSDVCRRKHERRLAALSG